MRRDYFYAVDVEVIRFLATPVAAVEHSGDPALEHETARRRIAWRSAHRLPPERRATYGVRHADPRTTPSAKWLVEPAPGER